MREQHLHATLTLTIVFCCLRHTQTDEENFMFFPGDTKTKAWSLSHSPALDAINGAVWSETRSEVPPYLGTPPSSLPALPPPTTIRNVFVCILGGGS